MRLECLRIEYLNGRSAVSKDTNLKNNVYVREGYALAPRLDTARFLKIQRLEKIARSTAVRRTFPSINRANPGEAAGENTCGGKETIVILSEKQLLQVNQRYRSV